MSTARPLAAALAILIALCPCHAQAGASDEAATPARRLLRHAVEVMAGPPEAAARALRARCTDRFNEAVPEAALVAQLTQLRAGPVGEGPLRIERYDAGETARRVAALVRSQDTGAPLRISLAADEPGERIAGLNITPVGVGGKLGVASWHDLDDHLAALHGRTSLCAAALTDSGLEPVHAYNADAPMAVGSTFKLYVLIALAEMIERGEAGWDDSLSIENAHKSLPSGTMQHEPAGTEHDLAHFAAKMISISDNTATDHLMRLVGRDRVEEVFERFGGEPVPTLPFLTTMEMFTIKLSGDAALGRRYAEADIAERRRMLAPGGAVAEASPDRFLASVWARPTHVERVEWFATTADLCRLMAHLDRLGRRDGMEPVADALRRNTGLALMRADWNGASYKGGSEPGVLNFTWLLERTDGRRIALSMTWNDPEAPLDEPTLLDLASEAIALLHDHRP